MISRIFSRKFRNSHKDYLANLGFSTGIVLIMLDTRPTLEEEPGYHKISDYYTKVLKKYKNYEDKIHWHFHPMSTYNEAHRCATSYANSPELYQILCRKIIERNFFPQSSEPGFRLKDQIVICF